MAPEIDKNLERLIHRQLKELPPLKAPPVLLMRVLSAARARQALAWWQQPIWHWPTWVKAAFVVIAAGIMMSLTGGTWWAGELAANPPEFANRGIDMAQSLAGTVSPLTNVMSVLWRSFLQTAVISALAVAGVMYLICVGAGTLFVRVAWKRA